MYYGYYLNYFLIVKFLFGFTSNIWNMLLLYNFIDIVRVLLCIKLPLDTYIIITFIINVQL